MTTLTREQVVQLLPCPFCGSTDARNVSAGCAGPTNHFHAGDKIFAVNCGECGASVPNRYKNNLVVDAWNKLAARADLEEIIAEQAKELTDLRLQCITDFGQYQEAHEKIAEQAKEIDRLNYMITQMWSNEPEWINELRSLAKESVSLRQQLQASLAREAQLRAMILKQGLQLHPDKTKSELKEKIDGLFPSDDTALREYGAKLVDFAYEEGMLCKADYFLLRDKIRK